MDEEFKKSLGVPAVFANRFYVARTPGQLTRIAFAEIVDQEINYRVAIQLEEANCLALRDFLNNMYPPAAKQN